MRNVHRGQIAGDFGGLQVVAGEEKHYFGSEIDPPARWLDFSDDGDALEFLRRGWEGGRGDAER